MFEHGVEALLFISESQNSSIYESMTSLVMEHCLTRSTKKFFNPTEKIETYNDIISIIKSLPDEHQYYFRIFINNGHDGNFGTLNAIKIKKPHLKTVKLREDYFFSLIEDFEMILKANEYLPETYSGIRKNGFDWREVA